MQVLDMDIAWAHGTLGLRDWWLCLGGMFYGILIIVFSLFVMHAVLSVRHSTAQSTASLARWFMLFLHFELVAYVALVLLKFLLLCQLKKNFFKLMDEDCSVLRFHFAERSICRFILGSWCCWVFSSFAYFLAWGDGVVDDATLPDGPLPMGRTPLPSEMQMPHRGFQHVNGYAPVPTSAPQASVQTQSYAPVPSSSPQVQMSVHTSLDKRSPVAEPMSSTYKYAPVPTTSTPQQGHRMAGGYVPGTYSAAGQTSGGGYVQGPAYAGAIRPASGSQRWLN